MKRRSIMSGVVLLPALALLAACDKDEPTDSEITVDELKEVDETDTEQFGEDLQDSVMMNGSLIFGPEDFYVSKIIVLDLGSAKSKTFYEKYVETIKVSYDTDHRGFGLALVDFSDLDEGAHDHGDDEEHLHGGTFALTSASIALSVYETDKKLFWDFLTKVYEQLDT